MAVTQVVLVDQTHEIDAGLLHNAALALDSQVTQDLPRYWSGITANVSAVPALSAVPHGAWPVFLVRSLPPGEGGYHTDKHNQPMPKSSPRGARLLKASKLARWQKSRLAWPMTNAHPSSRPCTLSPQPPSISISQGKFAFSPLEPARPPRPFPRPNPCPLLRPVTWLLEKMQSSLASNSQK